MHHLCVCGALEKRHIWESFVNPKVKFVPWRWCHKTMKIQNGRTHFSCTFSQCSYLWRITLVLTTAFTNLFLKRQKWIFWKYIFFFAPWQHGEECATILTIPAVDSYPRTMQKYQEMAHRGYSQQLVQHTHPRLCHFFDFLMFCGVFWSIWWRHQKVLMTMAP